MTHNCREYLHGKPRPEETRTCRDWVHARLMTGDSETLLDWQHVAPHALFTYPSDEHFLPLFVTLGAAGEKHRTEWLWGGWVEESIAADYYHFQPLFAPASGTELTFAVYATLLHYLAR